jgi:hypothetical protein
MSLKLTGTAVYPTFETNVQNGRGVVRFSGTSNPLTHTGTFTFRHLWIVAKYSGGSTFANAAGLITNTAGTIGLYGVNGDDVFADITGMGGVSWKAYVGGVLVANNAIPIPLTFKLIELRADAPVSMAGLVLGRKGTGGAKWNGDFGEMFFSQAKLLTDVREIEESLMTKWGLS